MPPASRLSNKSCSQGLCLILPASGVREPLHVCFAGDMCPPGGYCLAGATEVTPCSPGFYNPRYGATSAAACLHCPFGSYCSGSAVTDGGITGPCREGYYCKEGSANDQAYPAPQGSFAPMRSSSPILCYPGTFQSAQGQASCRACPAGKYCQRIGMTDGTVCPKSSYCPEGSVAPELCPAGTYSSKEGSQVSSDCSPCSEGKYCGAKGLMAPSGACQAGFYCGGGSASSAPQVTLYMPPKFCACSSTAERGQTKAGNIVVVCGLCALFNTSFVSVFFQAQNGGNQVCPAGHYCPAGSREPSPCPKGTYLGSQQAQSEAACLPCNPGM
ncbi:signal peptide, CUB and EGF-like domain-containing protein 3 [Cyclospora cayetanensis]|uniref:Signal peptide, CUB and EGF-like domain-containing protein 3 n=1 Tax=Cyclospora cayetanensis TaxID=88456 RepID=A0A6P6RW79_9EIME|nr:signal peptide, CUB and EGF-like domain-containing protein 3 [Cyclospora cayetanensis]